MRDIVMNEASKAAALISGQAKVDDVRSAISLIARYDIQAAQIDALTTKAHINQLLPKLYRGIDVRQYEKQVTYYVEHAHEYPLSKIDGVPITQKELDVIGIRDGVRAKCFAFALLAIAKYDTMRFPDVNYWVHGDRRHEVTRRANLTLNERDLGLTVHHMYKDNLVGLAERIDNLNLHVLFAEPDGAPAMVLDDADFRDLGYCLRAHLGERYTKCAECGRWIKQKARGVAKRYCDDCAADNQRVVDAAYRRRQRA